MFGGFRTYVTKTVVVSDLELLNQAVLGFV